MTKDELWEKYQVTVTLDGKPIDVFVDKARFLAALKEYGEHVKAVAVKVCNEEKISEEVITSSVQNGYNLACIDCAAAIEKMPLP